MLSRELTKGLEAETTSLKRERIILTQVASLDQLKLVNVGELT